MRDVLKLKKKYQSSRIDLFKKLASTNDGFYFNKKEEPLVIEYKKFNTHPI